MHSSFATNPSYLINAHFDYYFLQSLPLSSLVCVWSVNIFKKGRSVGARNVHTQLIYKKSGVRSSFRNPSFSLRPAPNPSHSTVFSPKSLFLTCAPHLNITKFLMVNARTININVIVPWSQRFLYNLLFFTMQNLHIPKKMKKNEVNQ